MYYKSKLHAIITLHAFIVGFIMRGDKAGLLLKQLSDQDNMMRVIFNKIIDFFHKTIK